MDVLIYVEDPGAANYVAELPAALARRGIDVALLTAGEATGYLRRRGVPTEEVAPGAVAADVLRSKEPRLLLTGTSENPRSLALELIDEARSVGIESVGVVDAQSNSDHRFRGLESEPLGHAPGWLLVPDRWARDSYVALGYPEDRALVCGHPHYDYVAAAAERLARRDRNELRRSLWPSAPDDVPVLVFVAEVSTGLNPAQYRRSDEYTLLGRATSAGRTEVVLDEFIEAVAGLALRPFVVLRLHPKNTPDELSSYLRDFDSVSRVEPPLDVIFAADAVVGMTSMLLFEAVLLGRPTLSIVPREVEKAWLPSIGMGLTPCVTTREELRAILPELVEGRLKPPDAGRLPTRGSLERVSEVIERLLKNELEAPVR